MIQSKTPHSASSKAVPSSAAVARFSAPDSRISMMTRVLRGLGAAFLLASASTFLVQHWSAGNDLLRFSFLLAHTLFLLGAALFCGGKLSESRSARIFLWTSLAMVPVHFSVLGGLVFSQFASLETLNALPNYALWQAPSKLSALLSVAGALLVLVPSSWISARVLIRKKAKAMVTSYLALSALLLLPIREATSIGALALLAAVAALFVERRFYRNDPSMKTLEGWLVRILPWTIPLILVGRTVIFYPATATFVGLITFAFGLISAALGRELPKDGRTNQVIEWLSTCLMSYGVMHSLYGLDLLEDWGPLSLLLGSAVFILRAPTSRGQRNAFEQWGALSSLIACALALIVDGSLLEGSVAIVVGVLSLSSSLLLARPLLAFFSGSLSIAGAALVFDLAVGFENVFNWGTLSLLGVLLVLGAGYAERRREDVLLWLHRRSEAG